MHLKKKSQRVIYIPMDSNNRKRVQILHFVRENYV